MKRTSLLVCGVVGTLLCGVARAAVVDQFECKIDFTNAKTGIVSRTDGEFDAARKPEPTHPSPDIRLSDSRTASDLAIEVQGQKISVGFSLYSQFASREANGAVTEARQLTCFTPEITVCPKQVPGDGSAVPCAGEVTSCVSNSDPFGPDSLWSPVTVLYGTPLFNEQASLHLEGDLNSEPYNDHSEVLGHYVITCQFKDTLD